MQLFGRGLRRRLPPMLDGDPQRLRLVYSLLFSLPGTPVLFYGEEIGMGENLDVEGRMSVRTPMQWIDGRTAASRTRAPSRLRRPVVEGRFGPDGRERRRPTARPRLASSTGWSGVIRRRRETPELGWGSWHGARHRSTRRCWATAAIGKAAPSWRVHNLAGDPCSVHVTLGPDLPEDPRLMDLFDRDGEMQEIDGSTFEVKLEGYGYRWLRIQSADRHISP